MTPSAIIFDLDGTLLNSLADIGSAMDASLARMNLPGHPLDSYRRFIGSGVGMLAQRALPENRRDKADIETAVRVFREIYAENWQVQTRPYPGIANLLEQLAHRGILMSILSNKPHDFTVKMAEYFFPGTPFVEVLGYKADQPPKPDPAGAILLAELMGVLPRQTLFLGDSQVDIQTALAAKMRALGVDWGFRTPEQLRQAGAELIISDPTAILEML